MMYFLPEEFGQSDCLLPVSSDKLREMEHRFEEMDGGQDETDPVFIEYFQFVMEKNDLFHSTTILEAGALFEKLTKFAKG